VHDSDTKTIAPQDLNDAASFLTTFIGKFPDNKAFVDSAVAALAGCKALDAEWWLSRPVAFTEFGEPDYKPSIAWPVALHAEVARRAVSVLEDAEAMDNLVAQAAMILSNSANLSPDQVTRILAAVSHRLSQAANSPDLLVRLADVNTGFLLLTHPRPIRETTKAPQSQLNGNIYLEVQHSGSGHASLTLELLDLLRGKQFESAPCEGLDALAKTLADVKLPAMSDKSYHVKWPELQVASIEGASRRPFPISNLRLEDLKPPEMLKVVLHEHPVLVEYRNSLKSDEKAEEPKTPQP